MSGNNYYPLTLLYFLGYIWHYISQIWRKEVIMPAKVRLSSRIHVTTFQLFAACLGIIAILIGALDKSNAIFFGIGVSLLSTSLYSLAENRLGVDLKTTLNELIDCKEHAYDKGLEAVLFQPSEDNFGRLSLNAATNIDIMYNAGSYFFIQHAEAITTAVLHSNCKIRILLSNPRDEAWKNEEIRKVITAEASDTSHTIYTTLHRLRKIVQSLPLAKQNNIEIRLFKGVSPSSLIIVNGHYLRHIPHLAYQNNQEVPAFDISAHRGNRVLFLKYQNAFDSIWNLDDITIPDESYYTRKRR